MYSFLETKQFCSFIILNYFNFPVAVLWKPLKILNDFKVFCFYYGDKHWLYLLRCINDLLSRK